MKPLKQSLTILSILLMLGGQLAAQESTQTPTPDVTASATATVFAQPTVSATVIASAQPTASATLIAPTASATTQPATTPTAGQTAVIESTLTPDITQTVGTTPTTTATVLPASATAFPAEPPLRELARLTFDSSPDAAKWSLPVEFPSFERGIDGDNPHLILQAAADGSTNRLIFLEAHTDLAVEARIRLSAGQARISLRENGASVYSAVLSADSLALYQRDQLLTSTPHALNLQQWHTLKISAFGDVLRVSLNGVEQIALHHADLPQAGQVSISGVATGNLAIDDVIVWVAAADMATPTAEATTSEQATSTATPHSEAINPIAQSIPPAAPVMTAPLNAAIVRTLRPACGWGLVTGATQYEVLVANDAALTSLVPFSPASMLTTAASLTLPALPGQGNYWCAVRAGDALPDWSAWSTPRQFTVSFLTAPANNQILRTSAAGLRPTFTWSAVTGATGFQVEVATDAAFSSPVYLSPVLASAATSHTIPLSAPLLTYGEYYWRLHIINMVSNDIIAHRFVISPPAPPVPTLTRPIGSTNLLEVEFSPISYAFSAVTFDFQVDNQNTFASPESTQSGSTSTLYSITLPADGVYFIRARSVNSYGAASAWSATRSFTYDTVPPNAPNITKPLNDAISSTSRPSFANTSTGAVRWRWDLARDASFTNAVLTDHLTSTTALSLTAAVLPLPLEQGEYFVRVQASDAAGNWSTESAVVRFVVNHAITPAHNGNVLASAAARPTFTFSLSGIPAATHQIEVATDSSFSSVLYQSAPLTTTSHQIPPANALVHGSYYWRVLVNGAAPAGIYNRFSVTPNLTPPVTFAAPLQGQFVNQMTLTLNPVAGAVQYHILCDNQSTFASPEVNQIISSTSLTPDTLPNGTIHCKARGINTHQAYGNYGTARSFTFDNIPPAAPAITSPADSAAIPTLRPSTVVSTVTGATSYQIEFSQTSAFTDPIHRYTSATPGSVIPYSLTSGTWYLRVRAADAAANLSPYSATRTITLSATTVTLNRFTTATPTITFAPVGWATAFEVQVSLFNTFASTVWTTNTISGTATSVTIGASLPDGTYFIRIRARKPDNTWGAWSVVNSFVIDQ